MYTTDITESQWQYIKKTMNVKERKRKYFLMLIWNTLLYVIKTGCQWRMMPNDFPKWQLVYYYYNKWSDAEDFDLLLSQLREKVCLNNLGIFLRLSCVRTRENHALTCS